MRPNCPAPTMPTLENVKLSRIRFAKHGRGCADRKASSAIRTSIVVVGENRRGEQGGIFGACGADGEGGHGNRPRHLRNG